MFKPDYAVHPSRIIREHIDARCDGSISVFARMIEIPEEYVYDLVKGRIYINDFIAEKLSNYGGSKQFWLNLQQNYDRDIERLINDKLQDNS